MIPKEICSSRAGKKRSSYCPTGRISTRTNWKRITSGIPGIQEIAVIGVFSPQERGERLHAVVVPNFDYLKAKRIANAREFLRDQIAGLSNQLPKYKRLMSYQIQSDPLPRTTTRKIKRLEIKRLVESGQLQASDTAPAPTPRIRKIRRLESAVGQEVINCLRETYHRDMPIDPNMNLELDLGFDSMERIELLASLEQVLNLQLPEDFGAEIHTVRDLITGLEQQAGIVPIAGTAARQSWKTILVAGNQETQEKPALSTCPARPSQFSNTSASACSTILFSARCCASKRKA